MAQHILELPEIEAAVVEYAVQHNADSPPVGLLHQLHQGGLVPKMGVNAGVVDGVVLMVGSGLENGGQVNGVRPQLCQVVQLLNHTLQIAAQKVGAGRRRSPGLCSFRGKGGVPVPKALGENLVESRAAHPFRGLVHLLRVDIGELEMEELRALPINIDRMGIVETAFCVDQALLPAGNLKIVAQAGVLTAVCGFKIVEQRVGPCLFHGKALSGLPQVLVSNHQPCLLHIIFGGAQPHMEFFGRQRVGIGAAFGNMQNCLKLQNNTSLRSWKGPLRDGWPPATGARFTGLFLK